MMQNFTLIVAKPLLPAGVPQVTTVLDVNPSVTMLKFSTDIKGGFNGLQVGIREPNTDPGFYCALPQPLDVDLFSHVQLYAGSVLVWEGRVTKRQLGRGGWTGFEGQGYGVAAVDDDFFLLQDAIDSTSGAVLKAVIAATAPLLQIGGDFGDPGITHTNLEFFLKSAKDAINQFSTEGGGGTNTLYDLLVYEQRIATWLPRLAPATPNYLIDFEPETVSWVEDGTNAVSEVMVNYTPAGGSPVQTNLYSSQRFVDRFGFHRAKLLQGGQQNPVAAPQFAATYLAQHDQPETSATITRAGGRGLELPGGAELAAYLPRASEWVKVADQPAYVISHTDYDAANQTATYELGTQPPGYLKMLVDQNDFQRTLQKLLNPLTYAPFALA